MVASLLTKWAGTSELFKRTIALSTFDIILGKRFVEKRLLIKIDVEGAEYNLLTGDLNTIAMCPKPTCLIEICLTENEPDVLNKKFLNYLSIVFEKVL